MTARVIDRISRLERQVRDRYVACGYSVAVPGSNLVVVVPSNYWKPQRTIWKASDRLAYMTKLADVVSAWDGRSALSGCPQSKALVEA